VAAQDIVNLRIDSKIEELKSRKIALESGIRKMAYRTTHSQLDELIQEKEDIDVAIKEQQDMKDGKTQYHSQKLNQAIKRTFSYYICTRSICFFAV
jgi:RNA polymerase-binding transcription factor DksA